VAAGQVRVGARRRQQQGRVLRHEGVRLVPPADPQLVLLLLPPPQRLGGAVHLEPEVVLVPGADLAHGYRAPGAPLEADENRREILALHLERLAGIAGGRGEGLAVVARLVAGGDDRRQLGEDGFDAEAADVLGQVAPVRPDVGHRRARAALLRLEAPGEVGRLQQPVLEVGAVDVVDGADAAGRHHRARLLDHRVAAVVEGDGVDDAGGAGSLPQRIGFRGGRGERLLRDDVLAVRERGADDGAVQEVRRRVVHDVDVRVGGERLEAAVGLRHAERVGLGARQALVGVGDRHDVDEAEAAHRVDVVGADEAGPDQSHAEAPRHRRPGSPRNPPLIGSVLFWL
jgi:hypothetical protein